MPLREEAARYDLPFTIELQTAGQSVLPTVGDAALLNGLMTNLISNTLSADAGACITLHCEPGLFCYRDNGPGLPPDAKALLTDGCWSARLLYAGGLGLPLIAAYTKAMGWSLAVGPGPGTELRFTLPPAPPLPTPPAKGEVVISGAKTVRGGEKLTFSVTIDGKTVPNSDLEWTLYPADASLATIDGLVLESTVERMAERQNRRLALRRELAVLQAQELL